MMQHRISNIHPPLQMECSICRNNVLVNKSITRPFIAFPRDIFPLVYDERTYVRASRFILTESCNLYELNNKTTAYCHLNAICLPSQTSDGC